ncbi:hypothetical protein MMC10_005245 [Thelotrema lepadinum]|nr:hypothetical protein [Thelotrema lepadinum]
MSSMVSAGFQHSSRGTRDGMVDVMHTDMEKGIVTLKAEDAKDLLYQDLPDDQALARGKRLRPQSIGVYWSKTSYAAWRHIPTVYVVCKQDAPATVTAVRWLIEAVRGQPDNKVENVIELNTGDSPFLSQPDTIVGIFENLTQRKAV